LRVKGKLGRKSFESHASNHSKSLWANANKVLAGCPDKADTVM
jgi:hypothetical protein